MTVPKKLTATVSLVAAHQPVVQLAEVGADDQQTYGTNEPATGIRVVLHRGDVVCEVELGFDQSGMVTLSCGDQIARTLVWTPPVRWFPPHAFTDYSEQPGDDRPS